MRLEVRSKPDKETGQIDHGKQFTTTTLCQQMRQSKARHFSPSKESDGDGGVVVTINCKTL